MKRNYTYLHLLILLATSFGAKAQELVQNGSAELFDSIVHRPLYWTMVSGNWTSHNASGQASAVYDGSYLFYEGGDAVGVLQQDVDVSAFAFQIDANFQQFGFSG